MAVHQAIQALQQDAAAHLPNCHTHCSVPAIEKQFVGIKSNTKSDDADGGGDDDTLD